MSHIVLAGTIVADTETTYGFDSGCTQITITDVPSTVMVTLPDRYCFGNFRLAGGVSDLVLSPRGTVAWIAYRGRRGAIRYIVQKADLTAGTLTLDESSAIAPGSLRLNGATLTWSKEGHVVSVRLSE